MSTPSKSPRRPRIRLTAIDHERLSVLAESASPAHADVASQLNEELARADIVAEGRPMHGVVRMGSRVAFRDDATDRTQEVTLVYPGDADIAEGRVSILTPIGTALIGLQVGSSIDWRTRGGDVRRLTVMAVREAEMA